MSAKAKVERFLALSRVWNSGFLESGCCAFMCNVCMCSCVCAHVYACTHLCVYVHLYVCMYVCVRIYILYVYENVCFLEHLLTCVP